MLINSILDFKEYVGTIQANTTFKTLRPFIQQAREKYLVPFLGAALVAELEAGVTVQENALSVISLEGKAKELHQLVAASLAYYSMLDAMPFLNMTFGNNGIQEQGGQNASAARQWVYFQGENATADNADRFLDLALTFLEGNAADFPAWTASDAYNYHFDLLITSAAELTRYLNIHGSRRAFIAFRPYLERAEMLYIAPELGLELYEELKQLLRTRAELSELQARLVTRIKPALAQYALRESLSGLSISIHAGGFKVLSENDSIRQRLAASTGQLAALDVKASQVVGIYMAEVRKILDTLLQVGETEPADRAQAWEPLDNEGSASFWV